MRLRWEELSAAERNEFANLTINLISDVVGAHEVWALKSQTAALVAEVYHLTFYYFSFFTLLKLISCRQLQLEVLFLSKYLLFVGSSKGGS